MSDTLSDGSISRFSSVCVCVCVSHNGRGMSYAESMNQRTNESSTDQQQHPLALEEMLEEAMQQQEDKQLQPQPKGAAQPRLGQRGHNDGSRLVKPAAAATTSSGKESNDVSQLVVDVDKPAAAASTGGRSGSADDSQLADDNFPPMEKKLSDVWVLPTHAGKRTVSGELKPGVRNALTWGLPNAILEDQSSCGDRRPTRRTSKMSATK